MIMSHKSKSSLIFLMNTGNDAKDERAADEDGDEEAAQDSE